MVACRLDTRRWQVVACGRAPLRRRAARLGRSAAAHLDPTHLDTNTLVDSVGFPSLRRSAAAAHFDFTHLDTCTPEVGGLTAFSIVAL